MSRVAKKPIVIPNNVTVKVDKQLILIKSRNQELKYSINHTVKVNYDNNVLRCLPHNNYFNRYGWTQAGTVRSILQAMVIGVTEGFIKQLQLIGVGYRVSLKGNMITLTVGFSHSINYPLPSGIVAECPSPTEIVLKGADKQLLGQVASDLRSYRRPEPYKGKGIRYVDEFVRTKEAKKK
ncbi:50S ribosomal protein L6 [Candidatus Ishikawella capsulata]|nr:50S ribosomal protein L6 [Candidatus Ishikawaella capsulata]